MFFIKKLLLGFGALILIFAGGSGTQSNNLLLQGGGFVGIIVGFVVLYLFGKMVWRAMGCIPLLLILSGVIGFILYAIGAFNGGVYNIGENVKTFLGTNTTRMGGSFQQENALQLVEPELATPLISENFNEEIAISQSPNGEMAEATIVGNNAPPPTQEVQVQEESGLNKIISSITGGGSNKAKEQPQGFNPANYPAIYGVARVINGDTLEIKGRSLRIFAIDAPEANQTCADSRGRAYSCGKEAARWLKSWISGQELECRVMQKDANGNLVGICSLGDYDIGAALVNAGWAVSYTEISDIYFPYELQAQKDGRGLWQGQFYKPWDWREIQSKKPKIKVIRPKAPKKTLLDL